MFSIAKSLVSIAHSLEHLVTIQTEVLRMSKDTQWQDEVNKIFENELSKLLNRNGIDAQLNVPDFILAKYLVNSLHAFTVANNRNIQWHGAENAMLGVGNG